MFSIAFTVFSCKSDEKINHKMIKNVISYALEIEKDSAFLNILSDLTITVNSRGGYYIAVYAKENSVLEEIRFHNLNSTHRKMSCSFAPYSGTTYGISERKSGYKFLTTEYLSFWEKLFRNINERELLSISGEKWGYSLKTTLSDSTYEALLRENGDYFDKNYSDLENLYKDCKCPIQYRYQIIILKNLGIGQRFVTALGKKKAIQKITDTIYLCRTAENSEFDIFSNKPTYYCE